MPRCMAIGLLASLWNESQEEERVFATASEVCDWARLFQLQDWQGDAELNVTTEEQFVKALHAAGFISPASDPANAQPDQVGQLAGRWKIHGNEEQIEGLKSHYGKRSEASRIGGAVRASTAERDEKGHFKPKVQQDPAFTQQSPAGPANGTSPASSDVQVPASIQSNTIQFKAEEGAPDAVGPLPELSDLNLGELLGDVKHKAQKAWITAYGLATCRSALPKAQSKWLSDDERRSQGRKPKYIHDWFERLPKEPVATAPPPRRTDLIRVQKKDHHGDMKYSEVEPGFLARAQSDGWERAVTT